MKKPIPKSARLHVVNRRQWRSWLRTHYKTDCGIWLVYARKHTAQPRISYNDAVEEALCFGWIDSITRSLSENEFAQRFSPRKSPQKYSQANIERLRFLVTEGKVAKDVLATLPDLTVKAFKIPGDILAAIKANPMAREYFAQLSPAYVRIRIAFIEGARKRPKEFKKRLAHFVKKTAGRKQIGFGGIAKHY